MTRAKASTAATRPSLSHRPAASSWSRPREAPGASLAPGRGRLRCREEEVDNGDPGPCPLRRIDRQRVTILFQERRRATRSIEPRNRTISTTAGPRAGRRSHRSPRHPAAARTARHARRRATHNWQVAQITAKSSQTARSGPVDESEIIVGSARSRSISSGAARRGIRIGSG